MTLDTLSGTLTVTTRFRESWDLEGAGACTRIAAGAGAGAWMGAGAGEGAGAGIAAGAGAGRGAGAGAATLAIFSPAASDLPPWKIVTAPVAAY